MKNDDHFRIPHPQISLKQFSNIYENVVYFLDSVGGWKSVGAFSQSNSIFKNKKMVSLGSFILQLPHTVFLRSEKLTHRTVH